MSTVQKITSLMSTHDRVGWAALWVFHTVF